MKFLFESLKNDGQPHRSIEIKNLKVTVMGLGLNGGGFASALFFAKHGANVTVTDLRSREILAPTIEKLSGFDIRYVLGEHKIEDFENADLVIKNPAVDPKSPFLKAAKKIETDISIFLSLCKNPLIAVTGSKGKSTTVSAIYHVIKEVYPGAKLGGNITTSPLTFIDELKENDPVVLELSSWQLADIKDKKIFKPKVSVITNIIPDHLNRYSSMEEYVADKKIIYQNQDKDDFTLCYYDDKWGNIFASETRARSFFFSANRISGEKVGGSDIIDGAWLEENGCGFIKHNGNKEIILLDKIKLGGKHNKLNLLAAGAALYLFGIKSGLISKSLSEFTGIAHRMEFLRKINGVNFYNDTTATIPEAVIAAAESFSSPVRLISGGTDKNLDFSVFDKLKGKTENIYLLAGTATDKMIPFLNKYGILWRGPFNSLEEATEAAFKESKNGDVIIMSPGCTSFGMFKNEFDRGDKFKEIVDAIG
ncbi:MAG: UDP-N-acetylmuramoyl-L-alanine--D-glutamate ligase [Spirochaetaceae bacterium]|nr:UDP-N-acetylmuramoyl-L-alanine--D-glutamate ligase [Spirochaetaceae bacterium]